MNQIRTQVRRAWRRLSVELFLERLAMCWFVAFGAAAAAIAAPKIFTIENLPTQWVTWWCGAALAVGTTFALAWTWARGRSELDAAVEIDRRFGLKERVASSLSLTPEAADSPAGRALVADAARAIARVQIDERFRVRLGRKTWLPAGPALVALGFILLLDNKTALSSANAHAAVLTTQQLDNATRIPRQRLTELRKKAPTRGLKDAEALLLEIDKNLEKLAAKKEVDRKQALFEFNDLGKQLAERREKLGGDEELRRQFAGMKDLNRGPAEKMAQALQNGQWDLAKQELEKLTEQLKAGKLDEAARKLLEQQLKQLAQKLADAAAKRERAIAELKKQIEQQKRDGDLAQAGELQEKLDKIIRQQKQTSQLQQMAQQLAQCQQALAQGDKQGASQAMSQLMHQLGQMQQQMEQHAAEADMLDMAMEQLEMAKIAMGCAECNGAGCPACQGGGDGRYDRIGTQPNSGQGKGIGKGRGGAGRRPEDIAAAYRDSRVQGRAQQGAAVITGEAEGPNIRGQVREAIQEEMAASGSEPADPLVIEQLPRAQRENAEEYFNRLRDGE
jgi:hypothetical protein